MTDSNFLQLISNYDIICFSETWTNKHSNIEIKGYSDPIHSFRKFKHKRAKRSSGGLLVYIKDSIRKGVSIVRNEVDCIVWLKFDKGFFGLSENLFLAALYFAPENSPSYDLYDGDLFQILQNDVMHFSDTGSVFITGDTNSRVGLKWDYVERDYFLDMEEISYADTPPKRTSRDTGYNRFGDHLLDFCKSSGVVIVNGRFSHDNNIGKLTCITYNGQSTVDYLLTHAHNFSYLADFKVHEFLEFSNHAPVSFSFKTNLVKHYSKNRNSTYFKWNNTY